MRERLGLSEADVERAVDDEVAATTAGPASGGGGPATKARQAGNKKKTQHKRGKWGQDEGELCARVCVHVRVLHH